MYVSGTGATWWEDSRGFEFSLRKGFSHHFAFRAAFNLEWTGEYYGGKGTSSIGLGVAMDSTFILNSPIMVEWEEGDGFQRPVPMSEGEAERGPRWRDECAGCIRHGYGDCLLLG